MMDYCIIIFFLVFVFLGIFLLRRINRLTTRTAEIGKFVNEARSILDKLENFSELLKNENLRLTIDENLKITDKLSASIKSLEKYLNQFQEMVESIPKQAYKSKEEIYLEFNQTSIIENQNRILRKIEQDEEKITSFIYSFENIFIEIKKLNETLEHGINKEKKVPLWDINYWRN